MLAIVPFDWQAHDTYFVVAHMHYVVAGALAFPMLAALYYWLPLLTGRMAVHRLSIPAFWLVFVGFNLTFFMMHLTGLRGMPRRIYTYSGDEGWNWLNLLSSVGGFIMTIGFALVVIDLLAQLRYGRRVRRDPWKAQTLEWAMPIPPTPYNFASIPHVGAGPDRTAPERTRAISGARRRISRLRAQRLAGDAGRAYDVRGARAAHRAVALDLPATIHGARHRGGGVGDAFPVLFSGACRGAGGRRAFRAGRAERRADPGLRPAAGRPRRQRAAAY